MLLFINLTGSRPTNDKHPMSSNNCCRIFTVSIQLERDRKRELGDVVLTDVGQIILVRIFEINNFL